MVRGVLFDLGDTLIDFEPMDTRGLFREAAAATYEFLKGRGHELPPLAKYCHAQSRALRWAYLRSKVTLREFNSLRLLGRFCDQMRVEHDEAMLAELAWRWYEPLIRHSSAEANVGAMLAGLRGRGLKLAVVSNTFVPGAVVDRHMEQLGLLAHFPVRVYSSEVGYRKPHRRIFRIALERLGIAPSEGVFIGDIVKADILGARRLGMKTVLKQRWGRPRSHRAADFTVRRVTELPGVLGKLEHLSV